MGFTLDILLGKVFSQTSICHFESLAINFQYMYELQPCYKYDKSPQAFCKADSQMQASKRNHRRIGNHVRENHTLTTSIPRATCSLMMVKDVVRVWLCNRCQKYKDQALMFPSEGSMRLEDPLCRVSCILFFASNRAKRVPVHHFLCLVQFPRLKKSFPLFLFLLLALTCIHPCIGMGKSKNKEKEAERKKGRIEPRTCTITSFGIKVFIYYRMGQKHQGWRQEVSKEIVGGKMKFSDVVVHESIIYHF